jgi:hypothetical protein
MENTQQEPLFNASVSELGLAAFDGREARGIKKITLQHPSNQGLCCEILIPKTCLVVLEIFEPKRGYTDVHTTCYHGSWLEELYQFYIDITLVAEGRRRDHGGKTRLNGSFHELHVWIGSGQKDVAVAALPGSKCFLADNFLLKATFR